MYVFVALSADMYDLATSRHILPVRAAVSAVSAPQCLERRCSARSSVQLGPINRQADGPYRWKIAARSIETAALPARHGLGGEVQKA